MWTAIRGFIVKGDVLSRDNRFSVLVQWRSCLEALTTPLIVTYIGYVFLKIYILLIIIRNYYSLYTAIGIFHAQNNGIHNIYIYIYIYIYQFGSVSSPVCVWKLERVCSGQSFWLLIQRSRVRSPVLRDFLSSSGSGTGSTQPREPREVNWGATWMKKVAAPGLENRA